MGGETLYRNIPHRAGSKDVASWKISVPKSLRKTWLKKNQDTPLVGHVESHRTTSQLVGSPILLGRYALRRMSPCVSPNENPNKLREIFKNVWRNLEKVS